MANLGFGPVASGAVSGGSAAAPAVIAGNLGFGAVSSGAVAGTTASASASAFGGNLGFGTVAGATVSAVNVTAAPGTVGTVGIIRASQVVMEVLMLSARRTHLRPYLQINI